MEATLVFPVVLTASVAFLFFAVFTYLQSSLYQKAALTADRIAYTWDNSHKDLVSGAFSIGEQDGLYWQLLQDQSSGVFSFFSDEPSVSVNIPDDMQEENQTLTSRKMLHAAGLLSGIGKARLSYTHHLFDRVIGVQVESPFYKPVFLRQWLNHGKAADTANARVTDPVGFIRMVRFAMQYAPVLRSLWSGGQPPELYKEPPSLQTPSSFAGHDADAAPYLRKLVNGSETDYSSKYGMRHIDALDKSSVAHQAFCTYNKSNLLSEQLPKDADILQQGAVKGVVWHFFTNCRGTQPKPSSSLLHDLQSNGIVVVVHD